ncbi:MAG TPA: DUF3108 domain-containing protein [Steroidobacteraceae bacterium]|jgi:hypothetical protein|nr:DUF3108 domain-containing protein [Steroidobacteraceae bacterium]
MKPPMTLKPAALLALAASAAMTSAASAVVPAADESGIAPFIAHYEASWKGISVGTSDIQLIKGDEPGHYQYTWTITAHGVARLAYHDDLVQRSWLSLVGDHVRPDKYFGKEGDSTVEIDFDWPNKRATGVSETKPVDLKLQEGTQDVMSIQVEVMLDLRRGNLPNTFQIIDKDQVKEFDYTQEGRAKLRTAIGELDTLIVTSQRAGNNRILRMWFAPSLGFVPVQAERSRDGKLEIAMRVKSVDRLIGIRAPEPPH